MAPETSRDGLILLDKPSEMTSHDCVDAARNDLPVLAWHTFEVHGRGTLHEPIGCRLELYHIYAGLVMGTALDALQEVLKVRLGADNLQEAGVHRLS